MTMLDGDEPPYRTADKPKPEPLYDCYITFHFIGGDKLSLSIKEGVSLSEIMLVCKEKLDEIEEMLRMDEVVRFQYYLIMSRQVTRVSVFVSEPTT